jgi:hypothetical protein
MRKELDYSPVAALAMARAMRRLAVKYEDLDLLRRAKRDEAAVQAEINRQRADQKRVFNLDCPV